jgi:dihydrofolate synthase/folylpolyglutamate synthase
MTGLPPRHDELELAYRRSLEWLYRQSRGDAARDPGRMRALIAALDLSVPARTIHVVGTNGKGTVTAMTATAAAAAGFPTGCFISPHVEDFRERISVGGRRIGREQVVSFVERVRSMPLPVAPAFFELCLAMALEHFARSGVELAAIEAGVGARRDATMALGNTCAVAITPIALDHIETLGPGLADIAADKAAAIRPGVPAASAAQSPEVLEVLASAAAGAGTVLEVDDPGSALFAPPPGLAPDTDPVRARNQRLAVATARLAGIVSPEALRAGLGIGPLPGRGERFRVGGITVLLDGAHDPAAGAALAERAGGEYVLLFGSLRRKQGEATLRALEPLARRVFVTTAGGEPTTISPSPGRTFIDSPRAALEAALGACPSGGLLVIGGSLYLAGELRPVLRELSTDLSTDSSTVSGALAPTHVV